ncbi:MAG TPA: hypothetical protein VHC69_19440 [Polyangiaceae bacterium]|nr:hypothetical protein [Polyangiaceae bacterium]
MSGVFSVGFSRFVRASCCVPVLGLFACNAILGAGDYHVGKGTDAGNEPSSGGSDDGDQDAGASGGAPASGGSTSSGAGGATASGGKTSGGSGGKGTGGRATGGDTATGGTTAAGGRSGTGGSSGVLTPDDFVGEWDSDSETITTDCGDGAPSSQTSTDSIEFEAGSGGTVTTTFLGCTLVGTIAGRTATISPPVTCDDNGIEYVISGSFAIQTDGDGSLVEIVTFTTSGVTCTLTGKGVYTKFTP